MVLDEILRRNDLAKVDGRAIYEYEVTSEEYRALRASLNARGSRPACDWSNLRAAEFCIYIAEWWRRAYDGGPWRYEDVLKTLDMSDWGVVGRYSWLRDLIKRGVTYLGRELISLGYTQYLGTLATEGGLPLNLLDQEGNSLRRAFQSIFEELGTYGASHQDAEKLGKRGVSYLPQTFQKVGTLPRLLGEIALITWEYAQLIDEQSDPLATLNADYPGWKKTLPLRLDDAQARVFLTQIFGDARVERQKIPLQIGVRRCLVKDADNIWQLNTHIDAPKKVFATQLAKMLDVDEGALPYHLTLRAAGVGEKTLFASASRQKDAYRLDFTVSKLIGRGAQAAGALRLVAFDGLNELAASTAPFAEALDASPWIFSAQTAEKPGAFLSTGSIRTRQDSVIIAVKAGGDFEPDPDGAHERIGKLESVNRELYLVVGEACFVDSEQTRWRVRCAQESDVLFEVTIRGERYNFEHTRRFSVYGEDALSVQVDHRRRSLDALRWKSDTGEVSWPHAGFGDGKIRLYDDEQNVIFQRDACRLPDAASIRHIPGSVQKKGYLVLEGFGAIEVGCAHPDICIEAQTQATTTLVTPLFEKEGYAPANFVLSIRWPQSDTTTRLIVPFPAEQARFVADGKVLPHQGAWNAHALDQIRAEFSTHNGLDYKPVIVGNLIAEDATPSLRAAVEFVAPLQPEYIGDRPTGHYRLSLARIRSHIELALAGTMSLDARVELNLEWSGSSRREQKRLALYRYEGSIERLESGSFALASNQATPSSADTVELSAFRFQDTGEIQQLTATTDDEWIASEAIFQPGTWCVVGTQNGALSHRPRIFTLPGDTPRDAWSEVCEIAERDTRRARFRQLYAEMAEDLEHGGWSKLSAVFDAAEQLPATTFDALDCLTEVPRATAVALVKAGGHRIERWWNELNELPFAWYLISMNDWAHAFQSHTESMQAQLAGTSIAFNPQNYLGPVLSYIERQLGGPSPLFAYLNERDELELDIRSPGLQAARTADTLIQQHIVNELRELLARKNPDNVQWPDWHPEVRIDDIKLFNQLRLNASFSWRQPIADAPVLAAIACVTGLRLSRPDVLRIRRLRDFDTRWFDQCYRISLARALVALESQPNLLKSTAFVEA